MGFLGFWNDNYGPFDLFGLFTFAGLGISKSKSLFSPGVMDFAMGFGPPFASTFRKGLSV